MRVKVTLLDSGGVGQQDRAWQETALIHWQKSQLVA